MRVNTKRSRAEKPTSIMRSFAGSVLATSLFALVLGCLPPAGGHGSIGQDDSKRDQRPPTPTNVTAVHKTARELPGKYSSELSKSYRELADRCERGEFKGWADLLDAGSDPEKGLNVKARKDAWREHEDALTERLLPKGGDTPWDAAEAAKVMREAADGFTEAGK